MKKLTSVLLITIMLLASCSTIVNASQDITAPSIISVTKDKESLKPGETATVKLSLGDKVRELFDASTNTVHPINHTLNLYYGTSSVKENLNQINY